MHCVVAVGSVECCKLLVEAEADLERMEPWNDPLIPLFLCDVWGQGLKVQVNNEVAVLTLFNTFMPWKQIYPNNDTLIVFGMFAGTPVIS